MTPLPSIFTPFSLHSLLSSLPSFFTPCSLILLHSPPPLSDFGPAAHSIPFAALSDSTGCTPNGRRDSRYEGKAVLNVKGGEGDGLGAYNRALGDDGEGFPWVGPQIFVQPDRTPLIVITLYCCEQCDRMVLKGAHVRRCGCAYHV